MSTLTQKQRDALPASAFCGPGRTFPIVDASDVKDAASLIGKASNSEAVKRCIIGKAKRNGWALPDAWKTSESSRTVHPAAVEFALSEAAGGDDEFVLRRGKVFECGDYPERNFSLTPEEAYVVCAEFQPFPIDSGHPHAPSPLDGQLGRVETFELGVDGKSLYAGARIPKWLDSKLDASGAGIPVSMKWNPQTKTPLALSIVTQGHIPDAALFAAYAEFAGRRNNATDAADIQKLHDLSTGLGAACDPKNASFSKEPKKMSFAEKLKAWITGGMQGDLNLADEAAAFSGTTQPPAQPTPPAAPPTPPPAPPSEPTEREKALDAQIKKLTADGIARDAAAFYDEQHAAHRVGADKRDSVIAEFTQRAKDDAALGSVEFSAGVQKTRVQMLREQWADRPVNPLLVESVPADFAYLPNTLVTRDGQGSSVLKQAQDTAKKAYDDAAAWAKAENEREQKARERNNASR